MTTDPGSPSDQTKVAFLRRRRRHIWIVVGAALFLFTSGLVEQQIPRSLGVPYPVLFVLIGFVAVTLARREMRCPACDRFVSDMWNAKFCGACGVALR